jgi:hypothetical protein
MILRIMVSEADCEGVLLLAINRNSALCPSREQLLRPDVVDNLSWWQDNDGWDNYCWLERRDFKRIFGHLPQDNRVYLMFLPNFPDDREIVEENGESGRHDLRDILLSGNEVVHWSGPASALAADVYARALGYPEEEDEED